MAKGVVLLCFLLFSYPRPKASFSILSYRVYLASMASCSLSIWFSFRWSCHVGGCRCLGTCVKLNNVVEILDLFSGLVDNAPCDLWCPHHDAFKMTIDDKEGSHYNTIMMCEPKLSSSPSIVRITFPNCFFLNKKHLHSHF